MSILAHVGQASSHPALSDLPPAAVEVLLQAATDAARTYLCRQVTRMERTEIYDGNEEETLLLREYPVSAVSEVKVINHETGTEETYAGTEFVISASIGEIRWKYSGSLGYFPKGFQNVSVKYTGGMEPVSSDIQQAVILLAAWMYLQRSRDPSLTMERLGDYQWQATPRYNQENDLPETVRKLLGPHRDRRF